MSALGELLYQRFWHIVLVIGYINRLRRVARHRRLARQNQGDFQDLLQRPDVDQYTIYRNGTLYTISASDLWERIDQENGRLHSSRPAGYFRDELESLATSCDYDDGHWVNWASHGVGPMGGSGSEVDARHDPSSP